MNNYFNFLRVNRNAILLEYMIEEILYDQAISCTYWI